MLYERKLASGNFATVDPDTGKVLWIETPEDLYAALYEGPSCGICDGLGHGAEHGLRPCPIEDNGRWDPDMDRAPIW